MSDLSLDATKQLQRAQIPLNPDTLKAYFLDGCKPPGQQKIGVEWEKIGVDSVSGLAIPYSGPRGVMAILTALANQYQWVPFFAEGHIMALEKNGTRITLEPGGQIELSGRTAMRLDENANELHRHLTEIQTVSKPLGVSWLGVGAQPVSVASNIEWVPKQRYLIMKDSLKNKGALTYSMMKETASVQVSLDYTSEDDAIQKLRLGMALTPILTSLFANSPFEGGHKSSFLSRRAHIWEETAPERTGILWDVFEPGFGLKNYVKHMLSLPMMFIVRNDRWISVSDLNFGEFIRSGFGPHKATWDDWDLHLTSLFTETRLKTYVEIRSVDCQKTPQGLAAVALIKGIFYDSLSSQKAWELLADFSKEDRARLKKEAAVHGLKMMFGNKTAQEIGFLLLGLSRDGLIRQAKSGLSENTETQYLEPLDQMIRANQSPAERLLAELNETSLDSERIKTMVQASEIGS